MSKNVFSRVGGLRPRRNMFDLSYRKNLTCNFGQLIPIVCDEAVPGDVFNIGNQILVRAQPMAAPVMHEFYIDTHYFFVPYRLLWDDWERFIVEQNADNYQLPRVPVSPYNAHMLNVGTLWDYFGFPILAKPPSPGPGSNPTLAPMDFPWRAYGFIYNQYYRDEGIQQEVDVDNLWPSDNTSTFPYYPLYRNWRKDYFTAARLDRVIGQAPALPVNIEFGDTVIDPDYFIPVQNSTFTGANAISGMPNPGNPLQSAVLGAVNDGTQPGAIATNYYRNVGNQQIPTSGQGVPSTYWGLSRQRIADMLQQSVQLKATTFDVSELRAAVQLQKWLERNVRSGGERYTTFLAAHFGVSPSDARLDRPEYIGGTKQPLILSEVLQTSQTDNSPQGNMSGHGISASGNFVGRYRVEEYGLIMGLMSIMLKPTYQDGTNRQWLRNLPIDFYFPEFAHLSEQAIYRKEIWDSMGQAVGDMDIFGYVGQYDEMRVKNDMVCGEVRRLVRDNQSPTGLEIWNAARAFNKPPSLNSQFITCNPEVSNIFLVQGVDQFIVNVYNNIKAARPLPLIAEPGLLDHF